MNILQELLNENITSTVTGYNVQQLQKLFAIINRKAFNGELPKITIKLTNHKTAGGLFAYNVTPPNGEYLDEIMPLTIRISKYRNFDAMNLAGILAHEMVHYKITFDAMQNLPFSRSELKKQQSHGSYFKKIAKMVEMKTGIKVPDREALDTGVRDTGKEFNVIVFINKGGQKGYNTVATLSAPMFKMVDSNEAYLKKIMNKRGYEHALIGKLKYLPLTEIKTHRTWRRLTLSKLDNLPIKDIVVTRKLMP